MIQIRKITLARIAVLLLATPCGVIFFFHLELRKIYAVLFLSLLLSEIFTEISHASESQSRPAQTADLLLERLPIFLIIALFSNGNLFNGWLAFAAFLSEIPVCLRRLAAGPAAPSGWALCRLGVRLRMAGSLFILLSFTIGASFLPQTAVLPLFFARLLAWMYAACPYVGKGTTLAALLLNLIFLLGSRPARTLPKN